MTFHHQRYMVVAYDRLAFQELLLDLAREDVRLAVERFFPDA